MPTIKTNGGSVILKDGKPSCSCCDGCEQCTPSTLHIYAEYFADDAIGDPVGPLYYDAEVDLTASGTPCQVIITLTFAGPFGDIEIDLVWDADLGTWSIGEWADSSLRCDPSGIYYANVAETITISTSPLP